MTNWAVRYSMKTIACMCILLMTQWAEFEVIEMEIFSQKLFFSRFLIIPKRLGI